ncbi:porin family protein [Cytophagaceae bacterium ABcell3]|nr:porin family protein [Cytophagaceae bacterium ABcell3]
MGRVKLYLKVMSLVLGIVFTSNSLFAQRQQSSIGIRGGTNMAASAGERNIFGDNSLRGYHLGFYTQINIAGFFGIQPEFLFSRRSFDAPRGTHVHPPTEEAFPFYRQSFDYLDIPIFLRFNIVKGFHVLAGPQLSNFLGSQERYIGFRGREYIQRHLGGNYMDLSGVVGLAYEFRDGLNIGVRYGYGLGRIHSITNFEGGNVPHQTQGMFTVGYTFGRTPYHGTYHDDYYFDGE